MPFPDIGNRKSLYLRYLQYSSYDRTRHSKHLKRWLIAVSENLADTSMEIEFGVDLSTSGVEVFTAPNHGLSAGDGPFVIKVNSVYTTATRTLSLDAQPSVGDTITITSGSDTTTYTFIARTSAASDGQINLGNNRQGTATNIRTVLSTNPLVTVTGTVRSLVFTAATPGSAGNSISISSSNDTAITGEGSLSNGFDPYPALPLSEDILYYIFRAADNNTFTLTTDPSNNLLEIRPFAAGSGNDALVPVVNTGIIYELLKTNTARVIAAEDDINDLAG